MIHALDIRDPKQTPIEWLPKVEALAKPRRFDFKPGLNILWGRNGSGKTTVIRLMTMLLHCGQGGKPVVTQTSLDELCGGRMHRLHGKDIDLKSAITFEHDGQGVRHFDPSHAVGLLGGGAAFDDEFFSAGVMNTMFKGSAGQTTGFRFDELLNSIMRNKVPKVEWTVHKDRVNDLWQARLELAEHFLKGTSDKGPPTVLLDEPERSYDLNTQVGCWRMLRAYAPTTQFIVASHSLFALKIPEANYIEMSPGYLSGSIQALNVLQGWSAEAPKAPAISALPPEEGAEQAPAKSRVGPARNRVRKPARKED
jgi:hypothetical protein